MNANELADKLLGSLTMEYDCDKYMEQAATMLRQQQAEIERLKALCITYIDDEWSGTSSYQAKIDEVNNERK
jgi:hypothetical protein